MTPFTVAPLSTMLTDNSASFRHTVRARSEAAAGSARAAPVGRTEAENVRLPCPVAIVTCGAADGGYGVTTTRMVSNPCSPQRSIRPATPMSDRNGSTAWMSATLVRLDPAIGARVSSQPPTSGEGAASSAAVAAVSGNVAADDASPADVSVAIIQGAELRRMLARQGWRERVSARQASVSGDVLLAFASPAESLIG
jgi:hypothetical protein